MILYKYFICCSCISAEFFNCTNSLLTSILGCLSLCCRGIARCPCIAKCHLICISRTAADAVQAYNNDLVECQLTSISRAPADGVVHTYNDDLADEHADVQNQQLEELGMSL